ncbi:MAG: hypothetical protein LQ349_000311 [Xanthoria aureola]|nr:MAG: hypothetical protein LQ349_000311 [Xanthoria aureola]
MPKVGTCFIAYDGLHYSINTKQREQWARAWAEGIEGANEDMPPRSLYQVLLHQQGPVTPEYKHPKAKADRDSKKDKEEMRLERQQAAQERQQAQAESLQETLSMMSGNAWLMLDPFEDAEEVMAEVIMAEVMAEVMKINFQESPKISLEYWA